MSFVYLHSFLPWAEFLLEVIRQVEVRVFILCIDVRILIRQVWVLIR